MTPLRLTLGAVAAACLAATPGAAFTARLNGQVIPPGKAATLTVSTPAPGEFAYWLKASSDGDKRLRVVQRRGASAFTVMRMPGPVARDTCEGAAGSVVCSGFTTPAPRRATYVIRVFNDSARPMKVSVRVTFRRVNAG